MDTNNEMRKVNELIFTVDEENLKCCDCGSNSVISISINNGVTLCGNCAEEHKKLGTAISYLKNIDEEFDDYLMNFLVLGSNSKFKKSLEVLGVDMKLPIETKYKTNGCDYYRRSLKAKVNGQAELEIDYKNPNDLVANPIDHFPEFLNYQLKFPKEQESSKEDKKEEEKAGTHKKKFGINSILGGFKKTANLVGKNIGALGKNIGDKVEKLQITDKIKKGGEFTLKNIKKAGVFVAQKAAPATNKIKQGANFVGHNVMVAFNDIKGKIVQPKVKNAEDVKNENENNNENKENGENNENNENNKNSNEENKNPEKNEQIEINVKENNSGKKEEIPNESKDNNANPENNNEQNINKDLPTLQEKIASNDKEEKKEIGNNADLLNIKK